MYPPGKTGMSVVAACGKALGSSCAQQTVKTVSGEEIAGLGFLTTCGTRLTGVCVCVKHALLQRKKDSWADRLSTHQIRGWRAVSAEGLQGKGLRKKRELYCYVDKHTHAST